MSDWTRDELKNRAKAVLRTSYWQIFAATLIAGLLSGIGSSLSSFTSRITNTINTAYANPRLIILLGCITLGMSLLSLLYSIFVGNLLTVGLCRYLMEAREGRTDLGNLFWAFRGGRYMNVMRAMLQYTLRIFLWTLLFIIPGIIKGFQYYYVPYLLAENPDMDAHRALSLSSELTHGEKADIFVLELSFLGWALLGILTCCIGTIFVRPYISATYAELYAKARMRAQNRGLAIGDELPGFAVSYK